MVFAESRLKSDKISETSSLYWHSSRASSSCDGEDSLLRYDSQYLKIESYGFSLRISSNEHLSKIIFSRYGSFSSAVAFFSISSRTSDADSGRRFSTFDSYCDQSD